MKLSEILAKHRRASNEQYQKYKQEHPGTKKTPSDPMFQDHAALANEHRQKSQHHAEEAKKHQKFTPAHSHHTYKSDFHGEHADYHQKLSEGKQSQQPHRIYDNWLSGVSNGDKDANREEAHKEYSMRRDYKETKNN